MESAPPDTSTTFAAREHARAQGVRRAEHQPTVPADATRSVSSTGPVRRSRRSGALGRRDRAGRRLVARAPPRRRGPLTDLDGDACANLLVYNAAQPLERLNVADTVKVQWQAYLGAGSLLLSDMGRVLLSIVADTSGAPRRVLRRVEPRRATRRSTGAAACTAPTPTPATASRWRWRSTGSADATSCPTSTCSRACASTDDGALTLGERRAATGCVRGAAGRDGGARRRGQHAPRARSPPRLHGDARCGSRRGPTGPRPAPIRSWATTPEGERAFLNTEELLRHGRPVVIGTDVHRPIAVLHDEVLEARAPWAHVVRPGVHAADRRPRRQPGRRLPPLQRRRPGRALQRARHDGGPGQHLPRRPARSCSPTRARR